jgi:hypothetical protein
LVPGEADEVTTAVAGALADQGFDLSCRGGEAAVEIAGLRGNVRVRAEVTADGSVSNSGDGAVNVFGPGYVPPGARPIPAGSVALSLSASRETEAGAGFQRRWVAGGVACNEEGLQGQTLVGCVGEWNGPRNEANRRLAVRRMRVPAAHVLLLRSEEPGVSSGCFFGFLAHGGRYLIFEGSWREGHLAFAKPELGYASGKGLDADAHVLRDGSLALRPPSLNERCEVWWNAPAGTEPRSAAARRGLTADVQAVYTEGTRSRCTYTLRTQRRYLQVVVEFKDGQWASTPLTPVEPKRAFRPNGELAASGWLTVGP